MIPGTSPNGSLTVATKIQPRHLQFRNFSRAGFEQFLLRRFDIFDAPESDGVISFSDIFAVRVKSRFKTAGIETDVKRLVEIRRKTENRRIPVFRPL